MPVIGFHLNVLHDADTHKIVVCIDGVPVTLIQRLGRPFPFTSGQNAVSYTQEEASETMRSAVHKNIKIYSRK